MLIVAQSQAQVMKEKINKIGIKTGLNFNMMFTDQMNIPGAKEQYRPFPRQGLMVGVYSRNRLTKVIKAFNYRSNVKNWYFQYELCAAYRGGNFRYYAGTPDDNGSYSNYTQSDTGRFKKISTFGIEMPIMLVWDYKNKQKFNLLFGIQPHYIINAEVYKANDPSPLYYSSEIYDDLVKWKQWGWSGVAGFQIMGEIVGFQMMVKYGYTDFNKRIAIGLDATGNINRTIPGTLKPFSIEFNMVF
ncbi:MAG: hypothetical protein HYZ42_05815 [Bacteroidetes bacterium]|nr:hypothetical protein [Bacteroidota bacterium]